MLFTNIIIFINTLILFFVFFFRKNNALPNRILALIILIPSLNFMNNALILSGAIHKIAILSFIIQIISPAIPVLIYIYVQLFLGNKIRLNTYLTILSAFLFVFILVITINFLQLDNSAREIYMYALASNNYPVDLFIYTTMFYAVLIAYLLVIGVQLYKYKRSVNRSVPNYNPIAIKYIVRFVHLILAGSLILIVSYITLPMYYVDYLLLPIVVSVVYFFIFYFSFYYNAVFTKNNSNGFYKEVNVIQQVTLPEAEILSFDFVKTVKHEKIIELLILAIEKDKSFINPNLTLKSLSEKIDRPSYLVSQAINIHYNKNFSDLINEYRIKEAQLRLKNLSSNHTIESVAFEVGFNSRASFYRAYKKFTGETPGEQTESSQNR